MSDIFIIGGNINDPSPPNLQGIDLGSSEDLSNQEKVLEREVSILGSVYESIFEATVVENEDCYNAPEVFKGSGCIIGLNPQELDKGETVFKWFLRTSNEVMAIQDNGTLRVSGLGNLNISIINEVLTFEVIEEDPIFIASPAATITEEDIERWNSPIASYEHWSLKIGNIVENILNEDNLEILPGENIQLGLVNTTLTISSVHNHDGLYQPIGNYLTGESDPIFLASPAASITTEEINKWNTPVAGYEYWSLSTGEERVVYGFLYNWYAATDERNIANNGWRLPSLSDATNLINYVGEHGGGKLKNVGFIYWDEPNIGATNELDFNARGAGGRGDDGSFWGLKIATYIWNNDNGVRYTIETDYNNNFIVNNQRNSSYEAVRGTTIRLIKDVTTLSHGQTGTYTGNDGRVYRTICIGTQEWLADNLCETRYRNGDWIDGFNNGVYTPISNSTWGSLTTGALCAYDDIIDNAYTTGSVYNITDKSILSVVAGDGISLELLGNELSISTSGLALATHTHSISDVVNLQAALDEKSSIVHTHPYLSVESDPIFTASTAFGITSGDVQNWNTSYINSHTHSNKIALDSVSGINTGDESTITIKTKLGAASGTTDGYLTSEDWELFNQNSGITPNSLGVISDTNVTLSLAGNYSEALLEAVSITVAWSGTLADNRIASALNWNTAFGWGDHAQVGYLTSITKGQVEGVLTGLITSHTHNYLTSFSETDPVFMASPASGITLVDIQKWDTVEDRVSSSSIVAIERITASAHALLDFNDPTIQQTLYIIID